MIECGWCAGSGDTPCFTCDGRTEIDDDCGECEGYGTVPCEDCEGTGHEEGDLDENDWRKPR